MRRTGMQVGADVIAGVGLADRARKSRWPARMDLALRTQIAYIRRKMVVQGLKG